MVREDGTRPAGAPVPAEPTPAAVLRERLRVPVRVQYTAAPLGVVFQDVQARYGVPVRVDLAALGQAGVGLDRPVSVNLDGLPLEAALGVVLGPLSLQFQVRDDHIEVSPVGLPGVRP